MFTHSDWNCRKSRSAVRPLDQEPMQDDAHALLCIVLQLLVSYQRVDHFALLCGPDGLLADAEGAWLLPHLKGHLQLHLSCVPATPSSATPTTAAATTTTAATATTAHHCCCCFSFDNRNLEFRSVARMTAVADGGRGEYALRVKRLHLSGKRVLALKRVLDVAIACGGREHAEGSVLIYLPHDPNDYYS